MGNEQGKQKPLKPIDKTKLDMVLKQIFYSAQLNKDRRRGQQLTREKELIALVKAPETKRHLDNEFQKASALTNDVKWIKAYEHIIRYADILKDNLMVIELSKGDPGKINDLLPYLESLVWGCEKTNLDCISGLKQFIDDCFGQEVLNAVTMGTKVRSELKNCFNNIIPTEREVKLYLADFCRQNGFDIALLNELGHNIDLDELAKPEVQEILPPQQSQNQGQNQGQFSQQQFPQYPQQQFPQYPQNPQQQYPQQQYPQQQYPQYPSQQQYPQYPPQQQYPQYPNQQFPTYPQQQPLYPQFSQQWNQQPNPYNGGKPNFPQGPNGGYPSGPNSGYPSGPNSGYPSGPNSGYPSGPNSGFPSNSGSQGSQGGYQGGYPQGGFSGGSNQGGFPSGNNQGGFPSGNNQGGFQGGSSPNKGGYPSGGYPTGPGSNQGSQPKPNNVAPPKEAEKQAPKEDGGFPVFEKFTVPNNGGGKAIDPLDELDIRLKNIKGGL